MYGIIRKELSQYFKTMIGYIFIAVFLAISGFYFLMVNLVPQSGDIKEFFSAISPVLLFLLPILTMRLFSEERKQSTDELLLTAPIRIRDIICGKYLAAALLLLLSSSVVLLFAAILARHGSLAVGDLLSNYLGFLLMEGAFLAIGLFISVLAENQVVAAVVTYAVLLLLTVAESLGSVFTGALAARLIALLSLNAHYTAFSYGILDLANVVYFASVIALFLFLSVYALESRRLD